VDLQSVDFVSGGAITNAAINTLLRIPGIRARARVIEPELLEASNLNRYAMSRRSNVGQPKAEALAAWATPDFLIEQLRLRLDCNTLPQVAPLAGAVVVGADDIPTRWLVQSQWPSWLCVGSTTHFFTLTSDHAQGQACAACLHPTDDGVQATIPTVAFVSYLAGLQCAARVLVHALGLQPPPEQQAVAVYPLRLDGKHAVWAYLVQANRECPVRCTASRAHRPK
jgi:tRNA A37 threonylcarbamoyladenosine dehydratase